MIGELCTIEETSLGTKYYCEYAKARLISEKTIKLIIQWFIYRALYCFKLSNLSRLLKHAYLLSKLALSLTFKVIGSKEPVRYVAVKYKVLFVQDLQTDTIKVSVTVFFATKGIWYLELLYFGFLYKFLGQLHHSMHYK